MNPTVDALTEKPIAVGLTGPAPKRPECLCALCSFATEKQPPCKVLPKLKELGYDIIGPAPMGLATLELARKESPDLVGLRIDEPDREAYAWIGRLWEELHLPVVVVTRSTDTSVSLDSVYAGAFSVVYDETNLDKVHSAFVMAALRGSALREAQKRIVQLERNLANRRIVEQAKWILVDRDGMTEPEAHLALQSVARSSRAPLSEIAQAVVDGESLEQSASP